MGNIERHFIRTDDEEARNVELFFAPSQSDQPRGAILFVHGHQRGLGTGARQFVERGTLLGIAARFNLTAAAVSQPGYGASDGPPDFCGPATQAAIHAALRFLRAQPNVDADRLGLHGYSRGAIASAVVATREPTLRALILIAGVYDFAAAYETMWPARGVHSRAKWAQRTRRLMRDPLCLWPRALARKLC